MTRSEIKIIGGVPTLTVDGKAIPEAAYITYFTDKNKYSDFAEAGYKLFSVPMYFSTRSINEYSGIPPFQKGIFEGKNGSYTSAPDFGIIDRNIREILEVCPDAYIFPRINMNLCEKWEAEHPDELALENYSFFGRKCFCFSSDAWAAEVKRLLGEFIGYVESSPYRDRIIGYQLAGGNTEEWFPFDPCASHGRRSVEAFEKAFPGESAEVSNPLYRRFLSQVVAKRVCEFARHAKACCDGRVVIGAFYGYTLTCTDWKQCHHAMNTVLGCDDIDFLCSPICYSDRRAPGTDAYNMLAIDSVKLHGKLYFVENDTRTHLSKAPNDLPRYNTPVWFGPEKSISLEVLKMHFSRALTHGHGFWWFDMWGGWFDDADYMDFMKKAHRIAKASLANDRESMSEVAAFIDEGCFSHIDSDSFKVPYAFRKLMGLSGVPYDIFLAEDFDAVKDNYKAYIFIVPSPTEIMARLADTATKDRVPFLNFTLEDTCMTPSEITEKLRLFGVRIYTNKPAVVYASKSYLFLHTAEDGVYDFTPGVDFCRTELFGGKEMEFPCRLEGGKSYLFKI